MASRLICLRGPQEQTVFRLEACVREDEPLTIGRESTSTIELLDMQASRRHAFLRRMDSAHWLVEDNRSTNGTFVNGESVNRRTLRSGDHVQIGDTVLLYVESEAEGPDVAVIDDELRPLGSTVRATMSRDASQSCDNSQLGIESELSKLLRIATTVQQFESLEGFQREVLDRMLQCVPADRAALFALATNNATGTSYGRCRKTGAAHISVSRGIIEQVCREKVAVLANRGRNLSMTDSIVHADVGSLIAAPLVDRNAITGIVYLDTIGDTPPFNEAALEFVAAAAALIAQPLENARRISELEEEKRRLEGELVRAFGIVGDSDPMQKLYRALQRIAPTQSTVLIIGETGTGKELVARAIHRGSSRAKGPFVPINCAAITENLLESEIFGHEKGAFTGALAQKKGKLELADKGSLFLDEVGELSLVLQAKLLRALQEREFDRVGGIRPVKVDVRILAATNRDLQALVANGGFRSDLYYRLNVVSLHVPSLRARREDILILAAHFLDRMAPSTNRVVKGLSPRAKAAMLTYDWPGNVRELQNAIERALVLGCGDWIEASDLADEIGESQAHSAPAEDFHSRVLRAKQDIIREALARSNGKYVDAARILDIHVKHLHRLMKTYGLKGFAAGVAER